MARFTGTQILRGAAFLTGSLLILLALAGMTLELATALDRAGKTSELRVYWEKMLQTAKAAKDELTAVTACLRSRASPEATLMSQDGRNGPGPAGPPGRSRDLATVGDLSEP